MPLYSTFSRPFSRLSNHYAGHPLRVIGATLKTIFVAHLFVDYFYSTIPVQGPSMMPTFEAFGDWLVVSKHYRRGRDIKVGDVIQFDAVAEEGPGAVKRVLGLQGDYVLRNTPGVEYDDMVQVPIGHCWVVGDNLPYSRDSRHFGPLPMALIRGRVIAKTFPKEERRWITNNMESLDT